MSLQPGTAYDFGLQLGRPDGADVEAANLMLKKPVIIIARHGRRLVTTEMPAGRFSADRQTTRTHRFLRPV
jgi:hypothetical protein